MIRKLIPSFLLFCCTIFTLIDGTEFYRSIEPYIPYTNGWSILIGIGYLLMAIKHKEGIVCQITSGALVLSSFYQILIESLYVGEREVIDANILYFDISFPFLVVFIIAVLFYFKKEKYKLF